MGPLRVRSADRAPGLGTAELFGRTPESVITDRDCSPGAKAMYGAITLSMIQAHNPTVCLATMAELARLLGISTRQARRLIAELETRGHVARERVRTISGSPQAIRPTAALRRARTRSDLTDCNRTDPAERPAILDRPTGQIRPPERTPPTAPLKREGKRKPELKNAVPTGERSGTARPATAGNQEPETVGDILGQLPADLAEQIRRRRARKSPGGLAAKHHPRGPEPPASCQDREDCTAGDTGASIRTDD